MKPTRTRIDHSKGHGFVDCWNSVSEYVEFVQDVGHSYSAYNESLGVDFDSACDLALNGDPKVVAAMREKLDVLSNVNMSERTEWKTVHSVAGTRVNVGDYLAGSPTCLRQRKRVARDIRFVKVYVAIAMNCTVSSTEMLNRGVYILAFLEKLRSLRINCEVYLMSDTGGPSREDSWQVIRVESNPLDLAVSAFAIAHPAFATVLTYSAARKLIDFRGSAPHAWATQTWQEYNEQFMPEILGMESDDVYIKELRSEDPFLRDPDKWLTDALAKFVE